MTIDDLYNFITLYQVRNISDAAVELNLTQSALSKRLKTLQTELGSTLISTRNKRRLTITESGEVFFRYAQTITAQYQLMTTELAEYRDLKRGTIHVGTVPVMAQYGLATQMSQFMQRYPQLNIRLEELEGATLLKKLQNQELDLGILRDVQSQQLNASQFATVNLADDTLITVLAADHPLAAKPQLTIADLRPYEVVSLNPGSGVYEKMGDRYQQAGFTPNIRFTTPHIETLLAMIKGTTRVTSLFAKSAAPFLTTDFVTRPFAHPLISHLQLVYPRGTLSAATQRFIQTLTQED
ncbi:LysR family transcriptional regulator [Levilactobacillus yiduensis]|uniref:LysR family transcriptional regulator n=1 Tax=Levilactobacillus yiduensis TaxID=2953880 RepID=UPI000EF31744|nr:LysR family transcriptional regulator [Levilactobacillus yiduensis]AYM02374.1 LysR family transcriptional regulator [Levilactobacillus brevis]